jgi:hypothetical protein
LPLSTSYRTVDCSLYSGSTAGSRGLLPLAELDDSRRALTLDRMSCLSGRRTR